MSRFMYSEQVLELVMLSGLLINYNFWSHVASDVRIDDKYLSNDHLKVKYQKIKLYGIHALPN